jgi:ABC-type multidrug transport system ATPase subunit
MLVVGRPGSGCTTFLKAVANKRQSFLSAKGAVNYGTLTDKEALRYRQQIIFNSEGRVGFLARMVYFDGTDGRLSTDDEHFPTLSVGQLMTFSLWNKTPKVRPGNIERGHFVETYKESILKALGIHHTHDTVVGNEYLRGVSGGERKRISIAECLAAQGPVQFWDNATRGLDASTALEFTKVLRTLADRDRKTVFATFYQPGNGIYDQFDKVLVIDEGRCLYYGPRWEAKSYFEELGFECPRGGNINDFLSSVTVQSERKIRNGFAGHVPTTAAEFELLYRNSDTHRRMMEEIHPLDSLTVETEKFEAMVQAELHSSLLKSKKSPYTAGVGTQIMACTMRYVLNPP